METILFFIGAKTYQKRSKTNLIQVLFLAEKKFDQLKIELIIKIIFSSASAFLSKIEKSV